MKKSYIYFLCVTAVSFWAVTSMALMQDKYQAPEAKASETKTPETQIQGIVQDIQKNVLTISKESTADTVAPSAMAVEVNDNTKLAEISSIQELKKGDTVKVELKQEGGKNIAIALTKVIDQTQNPVVNQ